MKNSILWDDYIFIFDTSSLINMYLYSNDTKEDIIHLLAKLRDCLWLPNQVKEEYEKHRTSKLYAPVDLYKNLIIKNASDNSGHLPKIQDSINKVENLILKMKYETKKKDKHPFLEQDEIDSFIVSVDKFKAEFGQFKTKIEQKINTEIEKVKSESSIETDSIYIMINKLFQKKASYSFSELLSIYKEGKIRYEYDIPPGYMDSRGKNKKDGTAIFGDLIIWKEILDIGKQTNKSVFLISNDTKDDWYLKAKDKAISPRIELINEYKDFVGKDFRMCILSEFIYDLNDRFNGSVKENTLEEVSRKNNFSIDDLRASVGNWIKEEFIEVEKIDYDYQLPLSNYGSLDIFARINQGKIAFEIRGMKVSSEYLKKRCDKIIGLLINLKLMKYFYFIISYDLNEEERLKLFNLQNNYESIYFLMYNSQNNNLEKV